MTRRFAFGTLLLALVLVVAACGDDDDATATTVAATTATTNDDTTATTAAAAATTVATTTAAMVDEPVTVGFASATQPSYAPALLGIETAGTVPMEAVFFQQSELAVQALLQGEIDILAIGVNGPMIAINEGAELVIIAVTIGNDWALVSTTDIATPADLEGKTIAIHSETSTATPLVRSTLEDAGVEAEFVIIPGSPNRAAAMSAGQIDATPLFLSSSIQLELEASDRFHTLVDYGEVPLASQALVTTRSWLAEHGDVATAIVRQFIETGRRISNDETWATEALSALFPDDDPAYLARLVQEYVARNLWVTDGGSALLARFGEAVQSNIARGSLPEDALTEVSDYVDLTAMNAALAELG